VQKQQYSERQKSSTGDDSIPKFPLIVDLLMQNPILQGEMHTLMISGMTQLWPGFDFETAKA
jgi:hypothetical protein